MLFRSEYRAGVSVERSIGRSLRLTFSARYEKDKSKNQGGRNFDEWITGIGLTYQALGNRRR